MDKKSLKKYLVLLILVIVGLNILGCSVIRDKISVARGDLIGNNFIISVFDSYANKTLSMEGKKVGISLFEGDKYREDAGYSSSVLEITINGSQVIQVGNTIVFAEDGLDMVEDFQIDNNIEGKPGGGLIGVDRYVNNIKNKLGNKKTIIISSPLGTPIGVYQGKKVYVTVPDDLPKMTRLNIDGKSLYIHRANYMILDTDIIN